MGRPREIFFEELEAWLRELPFWEGATDEYAMLGPGSAEKLAHGGKRGQGKQASIVERHAINRVTLKRRALFLREQIRLLPERSQQFIHFHYLARTPTLGHSMRETCRMFELTKDDYYAMRERALLPIVIALYVHHMDLGRPYDYCYRTEGGRTD